MAVTKGLNSYVAVAEADAYFIDRLNASAWSSASETAKGQALVTATMLLDNQRWVGTAISEEQPLAFPRNCEYFDPRLGAFVSVFEKTPDRITRATFELALHLLLNEDLLEDTGGLASLTAGPVALSGLQRANLLPKVVKSFIMPLLANGGGRSWWRAN